MTVLLAFVLVFLASAVDQEESVYVLGEDNFDSFISSNEFVLAEFYAPWCGHCKHLAPEYALAAQTLESSGSSVKLAKIDATVHSALSNRFGVQGYPTLKFFRSGSPIDYEGGRKAAEIVGWVLKKSGPPSTQISSDADLETFIGQDGTKVVAFLKAANVDTWTNIAKNPKMEEFLVAHALEGAWGSHSEGVFIYKQGEDPVAYDGSFDEGSILKWASTEGYPLVEELAQQIWLRAQKTSTPLLAVFHEESDTAVKDIVFKVAKANKGKALFSVSNRLQLLEQWGASGKVVPSAIMIVWVDENPKFRIWNEDANAAFDEAGLTDFVSGTIDGSYKGYEKSEPIPETNDGPVITVVGKTFRDIVYQEGKFVFLEMYAPWCGHCKKLAPVWEELATAVKDIPNVVVAKLDATANHFPDEVSITGFPTLIMFQGTKQTVFSGARDLDTLTNFVRKTVAGTEDKEDL